MRGIKRKKERDRKRETDTRHGKVEEKGRRGGRLETEETEESVRALSLATRSRTPVPTQHGTASHNRWKGNGGERHTGRRGREEDERGRVRERDRQIDGGRDPHSTPSLPTRTLLYALRDPRGGEHRDYRLPPTFSRLSLYLSRRLFTPPTSFSRALAPIYLVRPLLISPSSPRRTAFSALLFFPYHPNPTPLPLAALPSPMPPLHFRFNNVG